MPETMEFVHVPLAQLKPDPMNVRPPEPPSPEFVATIAAHGIKQPLVVRRNGGGNVLLVTDGGKRLAAAQACVADGRLPADYAAPCLPEALSDAEAKELSLMLDVTRAPLHPVQEFRAYADLHTDKTRPLSERQIAERFGLPLERVKQRLALGMLADPILDAWRDGEIDAEIAKAFTLCPERKRQGQLFDKLRKSRNLNKFTVRRELKVSDTQLARMLDLVGQQAYEARGGKVHRDLFDDGVAIISDTGLVKKMAEEKLASEIERLEAEGWSFVETTRPNNYWSYGTLDPSTPPSKEDKAALAALEKEHRRLQDLAATDSDDENDQRAAIEADEKADDLAEKIDALENRLNAEGYSAEQKKKAGCFVWLEHDGELHIEYGKVKPRALPEGARRDSRGTIHVTTAAVEKKAKAPATISAALQTRLATQLAEATREALVTDAQARWPGEAGALAVLTTTLVAKLINTNRSYWDAPHEIRNAAGKLREAVTPAVMNAACIKHFDAKDYFGNAPKSFVLAAIRETMGEEAAKKAAGGKTADARKLALAHATPANWLPKELRTPHYVAPKVSAPKAATAPTTPQTNKKTATKKAAAKKPAKARRKK